MESVPNLEEWVADSNKAISITLLSPTEDGLQSVDTFHPTFTYSIFEDEKILGYKDLKINLRYRANDMRPHLKTSYGKKYKAIGDVEATDISGILDERRHLPKVAFAKESDFEESSRNLADNWTPPGLLHSTIDGAGEQYEIWRGSLQDPAINQLHGRVQIFVPFFIEGGSYIGRKDESDSVETDISDADRWTVFFLYRKRPSAADPSKSSYVFVGYSTVYRFFYFQPPTPPASPNAEWELPKGDMDLSSLPCRTRLSQFVILPPFQGKGYGARLYKSIFEYYHSHPETHEFTVEDPNEAFDDLRDACDLAFLRTIPEFVNLRIKADATVPKSGPVPQLIVGGEALESIRAKAKIAPRQFSRVLEMHLMSQLPDSVQEKLSQDDGPKPSKSDNHLKRLWQLIVKQRLYRHNRDLLAQIAVNERIDKLQETLGGVELEYARLLAAFDRASRHSSTTQANGKRKQEDVAGDGPSKRARIDNV